jgi:HD-GYP domain-containing protein (c-di-GMP phosphodiesterase class II)
MPERPIDDERALETVLGPQLVVRLHGLLRALRLYDLSNQAIRDQLKELADLVHPLMEGEVMVVGLGPCFYVNGVRLRAQPSQLSVFESFSAELDQRRLGGLRLLEGIRTDELGAFLKLVADHADARAAERIGAAAAAAGVLNASTVTLEELRSMGSQAGVAPGAVTEDERGRARETFASAVSGARRAILATSRTGKPAIRRVKRVIQPIVDTMMRNEYSIVGLTALKQHDEYTYVHCVNVSILSVAMAHVLGFPRMALANLGVAALLHDLGKLEISADILSKPGKLDAQEWALMQRHPLLGLIMASRMPGLPSTTLDLMRVCLQHHRMLNGAGYPEAPRGELPSVLGRIVAVADCFDAMTAHRAYRDRPFTGYEALQVMLGKDQQRFDPAVLWALVKAVGLYPAGSLLQTSSGYLVVSLNTNADDVRRPHCRVLARRDGTTPLDSHPELWEPMPADESVVRVVPPDEFDFEVEQLLAA